MPKVNHIEFRRRWKKLHGCATFALAKAEYQTLVEWLEKINDAALRSLEEAEMDTLSVIKLNVGSLLKRTLLSTNPIESAFSVVAYKTRSVKNWKSGTDQASRWAASALLEAEKKFRKVKGYNQIAKLVEEREKINIENQNIAA